MQPETGHAAPDYVDTLAISTALSFHLVSSPYTQNNEEVFQPFSLQASPLTCYVAQDYDTIELRPPRCYSSFYLSVQVTNPSTKPASCSIACTAKSRLLQGCRRRRLTVMCERSIGQRKLEPMAQRRNQRRYSPSMCGVAAYADPVHWKRRYHKVQIRWSSSVDRLDNPLHTC
jgi:hypothetical protein